ncbi:zinc-binding dehydrogenase [Amnibacterium setariae]|nr:zinc-binding dehydrogenase [Amnibacterium setariae]
MSEVEGKAVVIDRQGGPDVLRIAPARFPDPVADEVRVLVETAGVAFGDLLVREGLTGSVRGGRVTPGYDIVGIVDAVGPHVSGIEIGARVAVRTAGRGGYATHVISSQQFAVPVPEGVDSVSAVALVLNYVTAWQMLTRVAPVGHGGSVLVHGAAGGVGSALAELALLRGLHVMGTASPSRRSQLTDRGVVPLDRTADWWAGARAGTPGGFDAVFDGVGGRTGRKSLVLLGPGGTLVAYGASSALREGRRDVPQLVAAAALGPRMGALTAFRLGRGLVGYNSSTFVPAHPDWFREDLVELLRLLQGSAIAPMIAEVLPLDLAATAHEHVARGVAGKVVLKVAYR